MTTMIATAGRIPLRAPLPDIRNDDLLSVVPPITISDDHWLAGGWTGGDAPGPAFTQSPCDVGTNRVKERGGPFGTQENPTFVVYLPAECSPQYIGDLDAWIRRLELVFEIYERAAVERFLCTGDGHDTPHLGDENMKILATSSVDPTTALRLLENEIARYSSGIIHASPSTVVAWDALNVTYSPIGGLAYTLRGTPIAVGPGYIGSVPDGQPPLATGGNSCDGSQQWAYATGPLEIIRDPNIFIPASTYEQMLDRSVNTAEVIAERPYLINWLGRTSPTDPDHLQAGVLIDEGSDSINGGNA